MVKCPKCGNPIRECHCEAKTDIIGKLNSETHQWEYKKDKNAYDFDIRHECKHIIGIIKVI